MAYDSRENCNAIIHTESNTLITGCKKTIIPNGIIEISDDAFIECNALTKIVIPKSVNKIGKYAFFRCESLMKVSIPQSVTEIGDRAFEECNCLETVMIPERFKESEKMILNFCKADITYY